jgi:alanine dehydrogenase
MLRPLKEQIRREAATAKHFLLRGGNVRLLFASAKLCVDRKHHRQNGMMMRAIYWTNVGRIVMRVGVPKEVKPDEYRVGMMPVGAELLLKAGHEVCVETNAGVGSGFADEDYAKVGAKIVKTHQEIFANADMIQKVKELLPEEYGLCRPGQIVFTYFHFAADEQLFRACLKAKITAIAYETIRDRAGRLPCLTPMSEIAGKMSIQEGAKYLERPMMGRGILLGGVPGVPPAHVVILGAGIVGTQAAKVAAGLGANVVLMDINLDRLRYLDDVMPANVHTIFSDAHTVRDNLLLADLVVGAVLIPGAKAPRLVTRQDLISMKTGSVIVDVAIDQGGCIETSRPTTHQQPTYIVDGVVHYCVTNMPGAVGRTSTIALCNATLPYALKIANKGFEKAAADDPGFAEGITLVGGRVTNTAVAESFHMKCERVHTGSAT